MAIRDSKSGNVTNRWRSWGSYSTPVAMWMQMRPSAVKRSGHFGEPHLITNATVHGLFKCSQSEIHFSFHTLRLLHAPEDTQNWTTNYDRKQMLSLKQSLLWLKMGDHKEKECMHGYESSAEAYLDGARSTAPKASSNHSMQHSIQAVSNSVSQMQQAKRKHSK